MAFQQGSSLTGLPFFGSRLHIKGDCCLGDDDEQSDIHFLCASYGHARHYYEQSRWCYNYHNGGEHEPIEELSHQQETNKSIRVLKYHQQERDILIQYWNMRQPLVSYFTKK